MYNALEDHLVAPRGRGRLTDSPHAGSAGGAPCGDLIRVAVELDGDRVADAGFTAAGCGAAQAAGSAVVELVRGTKLLEAARVTAQDVSSELGGLSPGKIHAATLAADALHTALGAAVKDPATNLALDPSPDRTLVAMSGGVDSAVAALLARRAGHEVLAVTLELWADPKGDGARSCCSPQAVSGARALAHSLGLPHLTLDLRDEFEREVVDDFVAEHAAGRTPNPCVRCNGLVRFESMLDLAERLGAARLATGHYARIARDDDGPLLRGAADSHKDQTYMLARVKPELLERLWFPLGEAANKAAVRALAAEAQLAVAQKPESQDLCFLAGIDARDLLGRRGLSDQPGEVVDTAGRTLAAHHGQHGFTVGQRRGLGVAAGEPLYVLHKDAEANRVTVGPRPALASRRVDLDLARLHRPPEAVDRVKLRYRSKPVACRVIASDAGLSVELDEPFDGAAPGQTACLLHGDLVVGWGTIAQPSNTVMALPLAPSNHV